MHRIIWVWGLTLLLSVNWATAKPARTSGQTKLDRSLRSWTASLNNYFQTSTVIRFDTSNRVNAASYPTGEVVLFYGLLDNALKSDANWTYIVFVLAHEWGHQLQHIDMGSRYRFNIQNELQADCLGAYYMFTHLSIDPPALNDLIYAQVPTKSDNAWTPWWTPNAHGTGHQRIQAISRGWRLATHQYWMGRLYSPWELYHACYH